MYLQTLSSDNKFGPQLFNSEMKVACSSKTKVHNDTTTWCHNSVDQRQEHK